MNDTFSLASVLHFFIGIGYVMYTAESRLPVLAAVTMGCTYTMFAAYSRWLADFSLTGCVANYIVATALSTMTGFGLRQLHSIEPLVYMAFIDGFIVPGVIAKLAGFKFLNCN